jgi:hypothetical protein
MQLSGSMSRGTGSEWQRLAIAGAIFATAAICAVSAVFQLWYCVAFLLAIPVLLLWPVESGLGMYAMLMPLSLVSVAGGEKLGWLLGIACGAALLTATVVLGRSQRSPGAARYWLLLVVWAGFTAFWALDRGEALRTIGTAISLVVLLIVAWSVRIEESQFRRVCVMIVLGGCLAAALAISRGVHQIAEARVRGLTGTGEDDPNMFAASLLLPWAMALVLTLTHRSWTRRGLAFAASAVITVGILFTMSRGALLSMAVIVGVFAYRLRLRRQLLVLILLVGALISFMPQMLYQRIQQTESGDPRLVIWHVGWTAVVPEYFLLGAGAGNFHVAYTRFAGEASRLLADVHGATPYDWDAHDIYLAVVAELGVVGALLFAAAVLSQLKELRKTVREAEAPTKFALIGIEAATCGLLVAGVFLNFFWRKFFWLDWMLVGQIICIAQRAKVTQVHAVRDRSRPDGSPIPLAGSLTSAGSRR